MANHATGLTESIRSLWGNFEVRILDRLAPIADLVARLYIAKVFFSSGWNKITDWESTLFLFREEYHVPLLPPELAAVLGTGSELSLSVMLALGLFTRFSACGLFVLNIVAVVSYYDSLKDSPAAIQDHLEWAIIISLLIVGQVRLLTVDRLLLRGLPRPVTSGDSESLLSGIGKLPAAVCPDSTVSTEEENRERPRALLRPVPLRHR